MFCKKCGNQLEEGAAFCKKCGTPAEAAPATGAAGSARPVPVQYLKAGIILSCILMALASALPYLKFSGELARYAGEQSISLLNANGKMGDGIIYIILAVLAALFLYMKKKTPLLICGVIPVLMYCLEFFQFKKQIGPAQQMLRNSGINPDDFLARGSGFYLLTLSTVALLVLCILYFRQEKNGGKQGL